MYALVNSVEEVKVKWKNLRDTYKMKCNDCTKCGGSLAERKCIWKFYGLMTFLDNILVKRQDVFSM